MFICLLVNLDILLSFLQFDSRVIKHLIGGILGMKIEFFMYQ